MQWRQQFVKAVLKETQVKMKKFMSTLKMNNQHKIHLNSYPRVIKMPITENVLVNRQRVQGINK